MPADAHAVKDACAAAQAHAQPLRALNFGLCSVAVARRFRPKEDEQAQQQQRQQQRSPRSEDSRSASQQLQEPSTPVYVPGELGLCVSLVTGTSTALHQGCSMHNMQNNGLV